MSEQTKYRSKIEEYFSWWLDELIENDLVESFIYEKKTYRLFDKQDSCLLRKCDYTPDFWIYFKDDKLEKLKALKINFIKSNEENNEFIIEIKPKFDSRNKNQLAVVKIKWLYQKDNIFVNMVHPSVLFSKTFTPEKYLMTDTGKSKRKINWDVKLLKDII